MKIPSYEETLQQPIITDAEVEQRVAAIVGRACTRQLWFMFLDNKNVQLPLLIPLADLPAGPPSSPATPSSAHASSGSLRGSRAHGMSELSGVATEATDSDRCLGELVRLIDDAMEGTDAASVVVVIERYGEPSLTTSDRGWAAAIHEAFDAQGISLRGILLSHRRGVRWVAQDDYRF